MPESDWITVQLRVNGKPTEPRRVEADLPLLDFLQDELGLTGTKLCCGIGVCRACTVAVRSVPQAPPVPVLSCSTPVRAVNGQEIDTVEGLAGPHGLHPLQRSFLDHFAFQCGYCAPGFLMAATVLVERLRLSPIPRRRHRRSLRPAHLPLHRLCALPPGDPPGPPGDSGTGEVMSARLAGFALTLAAAGLILGASHGSPPTRDPELAEYAGECARRIAALPEFDCGSGTLVPITVDGQAPPSYTPGMSCDRPSLLPPEAGDRTDGQCVPNSRALILRDDGKVQISAFCRQRLIRPAGTHLYDEIDIVLHSVSSGSTCWFRAKGHNSLGDPAIGVDGTRVPPPTSPKGAKFWNPPAEVAAQKCGFCHDSGPFYYSPFIGQTGRMPADPLGRYANDIGRPFQTWPRPVSLKTRGNTCTGCHRIGSEYTCQTGMYQSIGAVPIVGLDDWGKRYAQSHWMPIDNPWTQAQWEVIYRASVEELGECCKNPKAPGCVATPIPGPGAPLLRARK
jgi:aerobic-type carbon monoxide dehydrogenase small subunit (CoxS/CutS family)